MPRYYRVIIEKSAGGDITNRSDIRTRIDN